MIGCEGEVLKLLNLPLYLDIWQIFVSTIDMIEWRLVITSHNLKSFNVARHYKAKELNLYTVRRSGLGVVSWTCDPVLALGQRFDL